MHENENQLERRVPKKLSENLACSTNLRVVHAITMSSLCMSHVPGRYQILTYVLLIIHD